AALTRVGRRRSSATAVGRSAPRCPCLVESFAGVVLPETTALLAALAELGPDEVTRARARRVVAARPHPLPEWLARLGGGPGDRAGGGTHGRGGGGEGRRGARLGGHGLTEAIYIDHNLGRVGKDGFPAPGAISDVVARLGEAADDPGISYRDIGLAGARAGVAEAIEAGAITFPPFETET